MSAQKKLIYLLLLLCSANGWSTGLTCTVTNGGHIAQRHEITINDQVPNTPIYFKIESYYGEQSLLGSVEGTATKIVQTYPSEVTYVLPTIGGQVTASTEITIPADRTIEPTVYLRLSYKNYYNLNDKYPQANAFSVYACKVKE